MEAVRKRASPFVSVARAKQTATGFPSPARSQPSFPQAIQLIQMEKEAMISRMDQLAAILEQSPAQPSPWEVMSQLLEELSYCVGRPSVKASNPLPIHCQNELKACLRELRGSALAPSEEAKQKLQDDLISPNTAETFQLAFTSVLKQTDCEERTTRLRQRISHVSTAADRVDKGMVYILKELGNFADILKVPLDALEIAEQVEDTEGLERVLLRQAWVYSKLKQLVNMLKTRLSTIHTRILTFLADFQLDSEQTALLSSCQSSPNFSDLEEELLKTVFQCSKQGLPMPAVPMQVAKPGAPAWPAPPCSTTVPKH